MESDTEGLSASFEENSQRMGPHFLSLPPSLQYQATKLSRKLLMCVVVEIVAKNSLAQRATPYSFVQLSFQLSNFFLVESFSLVDTQFDLRKQNCLKMP